MNDQAKSIIAIAGILVLVLVIAAVLLPKQRGTLITLATLSMGAGNLFLRIGAKKGTAH